VPQDISISKKHYMQQKEFPVLLGGTLIRQTARPDGTASTAGWHSQMAQPDASWTCRVTHQHRCLRASHPAS
jgi:hypothetical protein